ncbi:MAG: Spy/CpxP family protein refolding chaperone [Stellaceae bacterium]
MTSLKNSISALALVATIAGGTGAATLVANPALAETSQSSHTMSGGDMHHGMHHGWHHGWHKHRRWQMGMRFLDGRIAFLKAVLKITPAEEPDFNKFADAMRANAKDRGAAWKEMRENHMKGRMTAVDRLTNMQHMTQMRAEAQQRLLAAFTPLYQKLSPEQQKVANRLATMMMMMHRARHHHHHGGHHHGRW